MGKGRRREAAALVIGQPEAASRPLFLEDAVLLHQVLDDALLVAVDPSREGHEQHPQRGGVGPHWPTLPGVGERVRDPGRVSGQYGIQIQPNPDRPSQTGAPGRPAEPNSRAAR